MSLPVRCCLSAVLLTTALLAKPAPGQTRLSLERSHDYLVPSSAEIRARATAVKVLGGKAFGSGERVSYLAFDGKTYTMTRFHGHSVDILLPDSWLGPDALSEEQARHFVDRTDLIYQHLLDMVGIPPSGDGPLPIAVVPNTCGGALGCGFVGSKGVEMSDVPEYRSLFWREIAEDFPSGVLVHEMTHNFDVFSRFLSYTQDAPHAWTTLISNYYSWYTHEGFLDTTPEEVVQDTFDISEPLLREPTADWGRCVRDNLCADRLIFPNFAWGGFGLRVAVRYGPQTVLGFSSFLAQFTRSQPVPNTPEGKNDLYVEALAAGAHRDLGCVADAWHWRVSDSLRQRMLELYGPNPDCQDGDQDGFSPLQGDCNDRKATVHPGALDLPNRTDDDCDGRVDETIRREPGGDGFTTPQPVSTLPLEFVAAADTLGSDEYQLRLKSASRVRIEICTSLGSSNFLGLFRPNGDLYDFLLSGGECAHKSFPLPAGKWSFQIRSRIEGSFDYSFAVEKGAPWPLPPWARTARPRPSGRQFVLTAPTALSRLPAQPGEVRFWVSGQGVVGTVPYSRAAALAWTPPPGLDPVAEGLTYRAEVRTGGAPVYEITPPRGFE
jgi:Putative metal-binding motif